MKPFMTQDKTLQKRLIERIAIPAMKGVYSKKGHQKQISVLVKTVNLFNLIGDDDQKYKKMCLSRVGLSMDKEFKRVNEFTKDNIDGKKIKIVEDYFYFVLNEIKDTDLVYKNNKNILPIEVKYYLYKNTRVILDNSISGKRRLARNYFKSGFEKDYKKATGRVLNDHKIAHLNKILEKYNYIVKDDANYSYIGTNNPFYYSSSITDASRSFISNLPKNKRTELNNEVHNLKRENIMLTKIAEKVKEKNIQIEKLQQKVEAFEEEHQILITLNIQLEEQKNNAIDKFVKLNKEHQGTLVHYEKERREERKARELNRKDINND